MASIRQRAAKICRRVLADLRQYWMFVTGILAGLGLLKVCFGQFCLVKLTFGIPCPGCGLTRGCLNVLFLHWHDALSYNAASFLWVALIAWWMIQRYVRGRALKHGMGMVVCIGLATIGYYVYRMVNCYPGVEPMTYNSHCLLSFLGQFFH